MTILTSLNSIMCRNSILEPKIPEIFTIYMSENIIRNVHNDSVLNALEVINNLDLYPFM